MNIGNGPYQKIYFFEKMIVLFKENQEDYLDELKRIQNLKKKL